MQQVGLDGETGHQLLRTQIVGIDVVPQALAGEVSNHHAHDCAVVVTMMMMGRRMLLLVLAGRGWSHGVGCWMLLLERKVSGFGAGTYCEKVLYEKKAERGAPTYDCFRATAGTRSTVTDGGQKWRGRPPMTVMFDGRRKILAEARANTFSDPESILNPLSPEVGASSVLLQFPNSFFNKSGDSAAVSRLFCKAVRFIL